MASSSVEDLQELPSPGRKTVILFWAPWHDISAGPITDVLTALSSAEDSVRFARVQAEQVPTVSTHYKVTVVPTLVFLDANGNVVERMEGTEDVAHVTQAVTRLVERNGMAPANENGMETSFEDTAALLTKRLDSLIRSSEVMLFMKGIPTAPRCGFSRQAVELLQTENIAFGSFDILSDEEVRQGLKKHSDWPTYPQLYVKGELQGGLDIMKELKEQGSLKEQLELTDESNLPSPTFLTLDDRLTGLVKRSPIMVFMKGLPSAPRCGFSRQVVELLEGEGVSFDAFDILQDEEVRQGLKKFSDWPTYPQIYVNGDLVGGLDIIKELKEDGSLTETLQVA